MQTFNGERRNARQGTVQISARGAVSAWFKAGLFWGAIVFVGILYGIWRPLLGLSEPPVGLPLYATLAIKSGVHGIAPSLFIQDAAAWRSVHAVWEATDPNLFSLHWRLGVAATAAIFPFIFLLPMYFMRKEKNRYLRGAKRYTGRVAIRVLRKKLSRENKRGSDHCLAPKIPFPASWWTRHVLITGGVGSGKSTAMKFLIKQVIEANEKLILFDPKGEFTAAFPEAAILAPWDDRSLAWDIGADLMTKADMVRFAQALIPDSTDPMWSNASRQILVGYMLFLRSTMGRLWGWKELAHTLLNQMNNVHSIMLAHNPQAAHLVQNMNVTSVGILMNLISHCSHIFSLAQAWGDFPVNRRISIREWVLSKPIKHRQIILQGNGSYRDLTLAFVPGIIEILSGLISGSEMPNYPEEKTWAVADEVAEMGKVSIQQIFSMGRSRNVRGVLACQDFSQLEKIHGREFVQSLLSMSGTVLVGKIGIGETAEMIVKAIGSQEVEKKQVSVNVSEQGGERNQSRSYTREDISLYKPSELSSRLGSDAKPGTVIFAALMDGDAYEIEWPIAHYPDQRPSFVPAAWTKGAPIKETGQVATGSPPASLSGKTAKETPASV